MWVKNGGGVLVRFPNVDLERAAKIFTKMQAKILNVNTIRSFLVHKGSERVKRANKGSQKTPGAPDLRSCSARCTWCPRRW